MEVWKDIVGFEGCYWVSNKGRVKSVLGDKILKANTVNGYPRVHLQNGRLNRMVRPVHRLVAEAFLEPQPAGDYVVNHIDEDKTNNSADNLEWVSRNYNVMYSMFGTLSKEEQVKFLHHFSC